jgi:hypothetical protein
MAVRSSTVMFFPELAPNPPDPDSHLTQNRASTMTATKTMKNPITSTIESSLS